MANEISASMSLGFTKNGISESVTVVTTKFTMNGNNFTHNTVLVPTSVGGLALPKGSIGTPGWTYLHNLDTSGNSVQILVASGGSVMTQLYAGEFQMLRFASTDSNPAAIALVSSVYLEVFMIEN